MKTEKQRFLDFVENYKKVYSIVNKEEVEPKTSYLQFNKYLSDNKEIVDAFENLVKDNGENGFISRPGTGKSTLVLTEVFNKITFKDNKKHLLVITLPNKAQSEQLGEKYKELGFQVLVGGLGKDFTDIKFKDNKAVVICVYEKITDIKYLLNKNIVCHLVIDEAHNITSSCYFRGKAIKDLTDIKNKIIDAGGSVILMTATFDNLLQFKYKNIVFCDKKEEYKAPCKSFNLVINRTKEDKKNNEDIQNLIYKYVNSGMVRYNDIEKTKDIIDYMVDAGKNVVYANGKEKKYIKIDGKKRYNNKVFDGLVNFEKLPKNDICFITSLADAGINVIDIEDTNKENYNSYFVVQDIRNLDLLDIQQYFNRFRFICNSYNLLVNTSPSSVKEYQNMEDITKDIVKKLDRRILVLNKFLETINFKYMDFNTGLSINDTNREIEKEINYILDFQNLDGEKENFGCIYYDEEEKDLKVDYNKLMNKIWSEYNKQFYYNFYLLKEQLEDIFKVKINVIEETDIQNIDFSKIREEKFQDIVINEREQLEEHISGKKISDAYCKYENTEIYQNVKRLYELSNYDTVLQIVSKMEEDDDVNEYLRDFIKVKETILLRDLTNKEKRELKQNIISENNEKLEKDFKLLIDAFYFSGIEKSIKLGCYEDFIEYVVKKNKNSEIKNFFLEKQYIYYNKEYKEGNLGVFKTSSGLEQYRLIQFFFKDGEKRGVKLTEENITEITKQFNTSFGKKYTEKKIEKMINLCFNIDKNGIVSSLKLK